MLLSISPDMTVLTLPDGLNMADTEAAATVATLQRWQQRPPDAVVVGGWPFLEVAAQAGKHNVSGIFIDAGAVAQDGLPEPQLSYAARASPHSSTYPAVDRLRSSYQRLHSKLRKASRIAVGLRESKPCCWGAIIWPWAHLVETSRPRVAGNYCSASKAMSTRREFVAGTRTI